MSNCSFFHPVPPRLSGMSRISSKGVHTSMDLKLNSSQSIELYLGLSDRTRKKPHESSQDGVYWFLILLKPATRQGGRTKCENNRSIASSGMSQGQRDLWGRITTPSSNCDDTASVRADVCYTVRRPMVFDGFYCQQRDTPGRRELCTYRYWKPCPARISPKIGRAHVWTPVTA